MEDNLNTTYSHVKINEKIKLAIRKDGGRNTVFDIICQEFVGTICVKCLNRVSPLDVEQFHKSGGYCKSCEKSCS